MCRYLHIICPRSFEGTPHMNHSYNPPLEEQVEDLPKNAYWRELLASMKEYISFHRDRVRNALEQTRARADSFTPYKKKKRSYSRTKTRIFLKDAS